MLILFFFFFFVVRVLISSLSVDFNINRKRLQTSVLREGINDEP